MPCNVLHTLVCWPRHDICEQFLSQTFLFEEAEFQRQEVADFEVQFQARAFFCMYLWPGILQSAVGDRAPL